MDGEKTVTSDFGRSTRRLATWLAVTPLACSILTGCAALTNPVANGIPVTELPPEVLATPKDPQVTMPLTYLRQQPPKQYLLDKGDVLGIYIEGVLGDRTQAPPIHLSEGSGLPPSVGYPIPVREDGTLPVPLVSPIQVRGMTIAQAEQAIVAAYTQGHAPILKPGRARVLVSLIRPRQTRVLVIRQDSPGSQNFSIRRGGSIRSTVNIRGGAERILGGTREGTGTIVNLPAYENDVLNALARSGGLPGLDAVNEIIIQRGFLQQPGAPGPTGELVPLPDPDVVYHPSHIPGWYNDIAQQYPGMGGGQIVRIPLKVWPGQPPTFRPQDIILNEGDIVFVKSREADVFYTGGLLPAGEFPLPRDYDLDALEAVLQVGGPLINGGFNVDNLRGATIAEGLGSPSPKLLSVLRRLPDGRQVTIRVDLHRAARDPRESLILVAGDVLVLQETPGQAVTRYFSQVFDLSIISQLWRTSATVGTGAAALP